MASLSISESIVIKESVTGLCGYLGDLRNWPEWSPWLGCDPDCVVEASEGRYSWEGKYVGEGSLELVSGLGTGCLVFELVFSRPWKARARVEMLVSECEGGAKLTWTVEDEVGLMRGVLEGKLPFFFFWRKVMLSRVVARDYQLGLKTLKELLEQGHVASTLDFLGEQEIGSCHYIGVERVCGLDEVEELIGEDFAKLRSWTDEAAGLVDGDGKMFTVYEEWDLEGGRARYRVCCPLRAELDEHPEGFVKGERMASRCYVVGHTGAYRHLPLAWSAAKMRAQAGLFKESKKVMPFEQYTCLPEEAGEGAAVALVCVPLR